MRVTVVQTPLIDDRSTKWADMDDQVNIDCLKNIKEYLSTL